MLIMANIDKKGLIIGEQLCLMLTNVNQTKQITLSTSIFVD